MLPLRPTFAAIDFSTVADAFSENDCGSIRDGLGPTPSHSRQASAAWHLSPRRDPSLRWGDTKDQCLTPQATNARPAGRSTLTRLSVGASFPVWRSRAKTRSSLLS